jgi:hypothetical protein
MFKGRILSNEHKKKISDALKEIVKTPAWKEKLISSNRSSEAFVRAKISASQKGKPRSPESIQKRIEHCRRVREVVLTGSTIFCKKHGAVEFYVLKRGDPNRKDRPDDDVRFMCKKCMADKNRRARERRATRSN